MSIRTRADLDSFSLPSGMSIQLADYLNPSDGVDLTGAWVRARGAGHRNIELKPGSWTVQSFALPDFTEDGNSWDETEAFSFIGAGPRRVTIQQVDPNGTAPLLGQASVGRLTERGQVSYFTIEGMTLLGQNDSNLSRPLIALSNAAKPVLRRLELAGNQAGPGILLYAYKSGGLWGALIEMCNTTRIQWETLGGEAFYSLASVRERLRYLVQAMGPRDNTGKCNDVTLLKVEANDCLIGCVSTEGFGNFVPTFPGGGGADNLLSLHGFYASQGTKSLEIGFLTSASSRSDVIARQDHFIVEPDDAWVDCTLSIQRPDGRWASAYIDGYTASTRRFILDRTLPIVTGNEKYRLGYGDAAARAFFAPDALQHAYYWEPNAFAMRSIGDRFEEIRTVTAYWNDDITLRATSKFSLINPYRVVDSVDPAICHDGHEYLPGIVSGAVTPSGGGANSGMAASFAGSSFAFYQGENLNTGEVGCMMRKINKTGHDLVNGDVVQEASALAYEVQEAIDYTSGIAGYYTSYIVWGDRQLVSQPDESVSVVTGVGLVKVKVCNPDVVDLVIEKNDFAVPMAPDGVLSTTGYATALASGSATVRQAFSALGVFNSGFTLPPGEITYLQVKVQ